MKHIKAPPRTLERAKEALSRNPHIYCFTDNSEPYSFFWNATNYQDGVYVLTALAYDPSGNVGHSNEIKVNVSNPKDTIPPVASIASPKNSSYVTTKVSIKVSATDNVGVSRIELYVDGSVKRGIKPERLFISVGYQ